MENEKIELIEETDLAQFELSEDEEENNKIKDELLGILQNKILELNQENNLLRSNLSYLGSIKEKYIVLLGLTKDFQTEVRNLKAGQGQVTTKLVGELEEFKVKFETLRENHVALQTKVETGYKPRINNLEKQLEKTSTSKLTKTETKKE